MMELTKELWGTYEESDIYLLSLKNDSLQVTLSTFGAAITGIITPNKNGYLNNIVLGYDNLQDYIEDEFYIGATVGRYAGRISNANIAINGHSYPLTQNDGSGAIHLHGGNRGFNKKAFTITNETLTDNAASVALYYRSEHLEEGYPGNLDVWVTYHLSANNQLTISYKAITDYDTHINLTNHSYFNLSGKNGDALNQKLFIDADSYLVIDKNHLPTGTIETVKDTPYNFKTYHVIADRMSDLNGKGYNECFILNKNLDGNACASLADEISDRKITLETDMPGLVFYSGDYLNGKFLKNNGICLETQFFPDSPNHPTFPSTLLKAGEKWKSYTRFTFSNNR